MYLHPRFRNVLIFIIISAAVYYHTSRNMEIANKIYQASENILTTREQHRQVTKRALVKYTQLKKVDFNVKWNSTEFKTIGEQVIWFKKYWTLQHKLRTNWTKILEPCERLTQWKSNYPLRKKAMYTSVNNIRLVMDIQPAGQYSRMIIYSYGLTNKRKYFGGDTWRIFVYGTTSVPVTIVDQNDGSYEASFLIIEAGFYYIDLHLDYTLCDGYKDPPPLWFVNGNAQGKYQKPSILPGHERAFLEEKSNADLSFKVSRNHFSVYGHLKPYLKEIYAIKPCYMWDGFGRWLNGTQWRMYETAPYKMKSDIIHEKGKGTLWIFGDSTGDFFYRVNMNTPLCKKLFSKCNRTYNWVYNTHADLKKAKLENDRKDFSIQRILTELREVIRSPELDKNSILLLNYGLHFTQTISFSKFRLMIEAVIRLIKQEEKTNLRAKIIWKTTTAFQKWKWGDPKYGGRFSIDNRFFTSQRVQLFNAYSTYQMCAAGFDVLDIYPMTLSYPKGTGSVKKPWDAVHYEPIVFKTVEDYLYKFFNED